MLYARTDPRSVIANAYQVIFGLVMIVAELRWVRLLQYAYFLQHYVGLGLFYIFVGGLILGSSWWMVLVAVALLAVGIVYLILGCACRRMVTKPILPPSAGSRQPAAGGMASDEWEPSQTAGKAYGMAGSDGGDTSSNSGPAYGGFTPTFNAGGAAGAGGGATGWGLNVGGVNVSGAQAMSAVRTAQGLGLTADHVVQGAQVASKYGGAYGQ